jgi:hypothetical protein
MSKIFIVPEISSEMDQTEGPNPLMLKKNYNPKKIISLVCVPLVLSSPALVQLKHSVVFLRVLSLSS